MPLRSANLAILILLTVTTVSANLEGGKKEMILDVEIPAGKNYAVASFRFWCPENLPVVRGLVVLVPGSNGDGRELAEEEVWQLFARRHQFALVGCWFNDKPHDNMNIEEYALAGDGSGPALLEAISLFAHRMKRPEAATVPLFLWGHSAGGEFNYEFACWKPDRVLAFVVNKGGYYYTHLASASSRETPGLFFVGEKDDEFRILSVQGIFAVNRRAGALWTLAVEPNAGHEVGKTRELAMEFFEAILRIRMPGTTGGSSKALAMVNPDTAQGWTGDLKSFEVQPAPSLNQSGALSAWLPDEAMATAWRKFVLGER